MQPAPLSNAKNHGPPAQRGSEAIVGDSEMARRIRAHNWVASPLGPIAGWSETLVSAVNMMLGARFAIVLFVGPEMVQIYNDDYTAVLGDRHPTALGQRARDCWPEIWPVVGHEYESVLAEGRSIRRDNALVPVHRNGVLTDEYYTYNHSPIFASDGSVLGILIIAQDTTATVVAERQLRASEARATRILRSIGEAVIVTDAEFRITRMNPVAEDLTGWPVAEARGLPLHRIYRILDEATHRPVEDPVAKVRRLGQTVEFATPTVLVRRDGSELPIDDSGSPIRDDDGRLSGIVLVFRDVSEQRRGQRERERLTAELRDRYSEIEAVFRTAAIAMALIDPVEFRYLRVNDRLCAVLNTSPETLVGRKVADLVGDAPQLFEALEKAASGVPVTGLILEGPMEGDPRGTRTWISDYFPVCGPDGSVQAIAAASAEITAMRQAEAALLQSEKLAAVGRLATSIAHEINNPLESVTNLLYIARSTLEELSRGAGAPGATLQQVSEYLDTADRELRRAAAITSQTLRFHKQSTSPREIRCEELLEDVLSIHQGRLVNSHVEVEQRLRAQKPICCFEGEIRQVLANLVGNAIDAMHPDGGRLLVRTRAATHWPTGRAGIAITIADTGSGMSPETLGRIFEAFFTTKGLSGTGLGLWVSREILDRHHGSLRVRSSQDPAHHGTVFSLFLPHDAASR